MTDQNYKADCSKNRPEVVRSANNLEDKIGNGIGMFVDRLAFLVWGVGGACCSYAALNNQDLTLSGAYRGGCATAFALFSAGGLALLTYSFHPKFFKWD